MVQRSIEQNLRIKNFGARNGNFETNAVVKNRGTKQREQRTLGDCWQWKANGQCSKGDNCSFRHDMNKRAKPTQPNPSPRSSTRQSGRNASRTRSLRGRSPSGRMSRLPCRDHVKGTCTTPFCEKWHPPECLLQPFRLFLRPILKFWSIGVTLVGITWANYSKRWVLNSNVSMTHHGFGELNTSDWFPYVGAFPQNR